MRRRNAMCLTLCTTLTVICLSFLLQTSATEPTVGADEEIKPVDVNMHDFMEGMFQAPYRRLKVAMEKEPSDAQGWKALRSDALILTEGSNLLLIRKPERTSPIGLSTAWRLAMQAPNSSKPASRRILQQVKKLLSGCSIIAMLAISSSKMASIS